MTTQLTWRDVNGVATVLSEANGYKVLRGAVGLGVAEPKDTIDSYIAFDGAALVKRRRDTLSVILPLFIKHATRAQTLVEQLATAVQGPGELEYADGVNTRFLKNVVYSGGLGGNLENAPNPLWRKVPLALLALDPWWYGPANAAELSVATATAFDAAVSFDAVLPFDGGASASVSVTGDTSAYPVITVTGPATTLTVGSGGLSWSINAALIPGDVLVVDHRPGSRGPRKNGGLVDWSLLTQASRLFTLAPGTTSVISGTTGSTGATSISMQYEPRFLTP